jgi:hypothetical protein
VALTSPAVVVGVLIVLFLFRPESSRITEASSEYESARGRKATDHQSKTTSVSSRISVRIGR